MSAHWFSGWPGAYCLKCGSDDPMEAALGDERIQWTQDMDPIYPSEEVKREYKQATICPVQDDPEKHPWLTAWASL